MKTSGTSGNNDCYPGFRVHRRQANTLGYQDSLGRGMSSGIFFRIAGIRLEGRLQDREE